ncbi:NAD(P)/FAD-dependent oxidoreductase [Allobranchiibius sp. GilTou73]|uniref:flavin-containing monooxygenase n=1 Tax=Allobranchiibius sp. GilTou73 TaxID=2904523 RepID=UPI001F224BBE|nr:NAD(P)/FAD-dependent oxidoreductase [Allobranchiibius sp. GilTou73]
MDPMQTPVDHDVVIIGSGFSGIGMAIALQRSGRSFTVLEKAHDIGGTWRDNLYPGCACDVPSHLYSFSFEPNPYWSRAYATADEIQDYLLYVVEKYDVRKDVQFDAQVTRGVYDESLRVWHLTVLGSDGVQTHLVAGAVVTKTNFLHSC